MLASFSGRSKGETILNIFYSSSLETAERTFTAENSDGQYSDTIPVAKNFVSDFEVVKSPKRSRWQNKEIVEKFRSFVEKTTWFVLSRGEWSVRKAIISHLSVQTNVSGNVFQIQSCFQRKKRSYSCEVFCITVLIYGRPC